LPLLEIIWGSEVMRRLWKMMENAAFLIGDAVAYAAWRSRRRIRAESEAVQHLRRLMREDEDYGGDCVFCMADIGGDLAAIEHVGRLVEKWKADAWRNLPPGFTPIGPSG
jgi:hypothetical protein